MAGSLSPALSPLPTATGEGRHRHEERGLRHCKMLFVRGGAEIFMHSVYIPSGLALALYFKISW